MRIYELFLFRDFFADDYIRLIEDCHDRMKDGVRVQMLRALSEVHRCGYKNVINSKIKFVDISVLWFLR